MTEEFDDQLRSELQDSFRLGADAATALDALGPAMARQRRNHNVRTGMLSSAVVLLASFGGLSLISGDPSDGEVPIAAVAPDDAPADA